jgi:hypothetical protein
MITVITQRGAAHVITPYSFLPYDKNSVIFADNRWDSVCPFSKKEATRH